jgi:hypothetical protein
MKVFLIGASAFVIVVIVVTLTFRSAINRRHFDAWEDEFWDDMPPVDWESE